MTQSADVLIFWRPQCEDRRLSGEKCTLLTSFTLSNMRLRQKWPDDCVERCNAVLLWSSRNVLLAAKLHPASHQRGVTELTGQYPVQQDKKNKYFSNLGALLRVDLQLHHSFKFVVSCWLCCCKNLFPVSHHFVSTFQPLASKSVHLHFFTPTFKCTAISLDCPSSFGCFSCSWSHKNRSWVDVRGLHGIIFVSFWNVTGTNRINVLYLFNN